MKCLFSDELFAKKNSNKDALEIVFFNSNKLNDNCFV